MKLREKNSKIRETEDEQIRQALAQRAEKVKVSPEDTRRMADFVHRRIEEENRMKRWSARKIAVVAAAVCVLGTITAIAAGKVVSIGSDSSWNDAVYDYKEAKEMKDLVGFEVKTPETFKNGYAFYAAIPVQNESKDADGNTVQTATSLDVIYHKKGMPDLFIGINGTDMQGGKPTGDQTATHGGVTVCYSCDNYRFVPPNYQMSEEEEKLVEAGELYISYGSSEVEDRQSKSMNWEDEGVFYSVSSFDNGMSAEEFFQMAAEIIDAE